MGRASAGSNYVKEKKASPGRPLSYSVQSTLLIYLLLVDYLYSCTGLWPCPKLYASLGEPRSNRPFVGYCVAKDRGRGQIKPTKIE